MSLAFPKPQPRTKATRGHGLACACPQCRRASITKAAEKTQRRILREARKAEAGIQRFRSQDGNEETAHLHYLQVEVKDGVSAQLPLFFTRAWDQAFRAKPIGSTAFPTAVFVQPEGEEFALLLKKDLLELVRMLAAFERGVS